MTSYFHEVVPGQSSAHKTRQSEAQPQRHNLPLESALRQNAMMKCVKHFIQDVAAYWVYMNLTKNRTIVHPMSHERGHIHRVYQTKQARGAAGIVLVIII